MKLGGKHSRACLNCRVRRIKCDLERPACSQCLRSRKTCSGYRDVQELMFRDESKNVKQKLEAPNQLPNVALDFSPSSSKEVVFLQPATTFHSTKSRGFLSILGQQSISPPSLDKGIEFFYDNYINFISSTPIGRAALPASPAWEFLFTNPAYSNACSAAGYAGLSNITGDRSHMVTARRQYSLSLRSIETTIQDNSSLAMSFESAMILTVFEIVVAGSWEVHIEGGAAIWKLMAAHGQTPSPRTQLYWVFLIFIKCLLKEEPSPPGIRDWSQKIKKRMRAEDEIAAPLAYITSRFIDLHALIKNGKLADPDIIFHRATELEKELDAWEKVLPPAWHSMDKIPGDATYAFQNRTHQYHNFWIARMLSNYRWVRILVNNLVLFYLPCSSPRRIALMSTIARLSTDICCSTSSFLEPCIIEQGQIVPFPVLAGCFIIIFPLAVAGCAVGVGDEMHDWVIEKLEMINVRMGVVSAVNVVRKVKELRVEWSVYGGEDGEG